MKFLQAKTVLFLLLAIVVGTFIVSCGKTESEKKLQLIQQIDTLLNSENIKYLEKSVDFMEFTLYLKKMNAPIVDFAASPMQYDRTDDRAKMLLRFGMLCTDMAYLKIIAGKVQLPEYDIVLQKYVKELNLTNIFKNSFEEYVSTISAKEMNDESFNELIAKFKADRIQLVNYAKVSNEDFLIYTTIGTFIESLYIMDSYKKDKNFPLLKAKLNQTIVDNGAPMFHFFENFWIKVVDNPKYDNYKLYLSKIKPIYEVILEKTKTQTPLTDEERQKMSALIVEVRNEFLK